jgi:hypothetical protein
MALLQARRTVRFAPREKNPVYIYESRPDDILWATELEFQQGRGNVRKDGRQTRHAGFDELLEQTFHKPASNDGQVSVQKRLQEYVKYSDGRGIERHVCKSHWQERKKLRSQANQAVLIAQQRAMEYKLTVDQTWETLREVCVDYCKPARTFARRMGKADEAACYSSKNIKGGRRAMSRATSSPQLLSGPSTSICATSKNQVGRAAIKV